MNPGLTLSPKQREERLKRQRDGLAKEVRTYNAKRVSSGKMDEIDDEFFNRVHSVLTNGRS